MIPIFYHSPTNMPRVRRPLPGTEDDNGEGLGKSDAGDEYLAPSDATRILRDPSSDTLAPERVETTIWERISGYLESRLFLYWTSLTHKS